MQRFSRTSRASSARQPRVAPGCCVSMGTARRFCGGRARLPHLSASLRVFAALSSDPRKHSGDAFLLRALILSQFRSAKCKTEIGLSTSRASPWALDRGRMEGLSSRRQKASPVRLSVSPRAGAPETLSAGSRADVVNER